MRSPLRRLNEAGVSCDLKIVEGAFHAFDLVAPKAEVVADFRQSYFDALHAKLRSKFSRNRVEHASLGGGRPQVMADALHS